MAYVFDSFAVYPTLTGRTLIEWRLHPQFTAEGPFEFQLQYSHDGVEEGLDWQTFKTLTTSGPSNSYMSVVDDQQRIWSNADRLYYRIILLSHDGQRFSSGPHSILGPLGKTDLLTARSILKGELIAMKNFTGICCLLYKLKGWGETCDNPGCVDLDTLEVFKGSTCETCFGTGIKKGYATPVDYYIAVEENQGREAKIENADAGYVHLIKRSVRSIACPMLRSYDLLIEKATDRRWIVNKVNVTSDIRGVPLILNTSLSLAEPTSILHRIPRNHAG